jgi:hypothetical protein
MRQVRQRRGVWSCGRGEHMERAPTLEPSRSRTGGLPEGEPSPRRRDGPYFLGVFIVYLLFFGAVGAFFSSPFPIAFGAFLFLTDGELIAWVLGKTGIRFVPGTLGPEFIKLFAFLTGLSILLVSWKDSVPAWLLPWLPLQASWSALAAAALACAVLSIAAVAVREIRRNGVAFCRDSLNCAVLGFTGLGLLGVLVSLLLFSQWP